MTTSELVREYYDTLKAFDTERLRAILAPDLVFEGPIAGRRVGAEGFVKGRIATLRLLYDAAAYRAAGGR